MKTRLEVQQREDIRRDLAGRMKFVPPDLRVGESVFYCKKIRATFSKDGRLENGLKVEILAVKGPMVVISTGASIFQVNETKERRHLDTVDLEELPDSRERTGAPVLWLSCEGQMDVWELFSDNSHLSAIIDRQGLLVAAPVDLKSKNTESLSPQLLQGFWSKLTGENPKIVVVSPTVTSKNSAQREVIWQQYRLCLAVPEYQIIGVKHFLFFGTRIRNDLVVEEGPIPWEKYHSQWTLLRGTKPKWIFHTFGNLLQPLELLPDSRKHVVPTEWQVRTVLGDCLSKSKDHFGSRATASAVCADQWPPGSFQFGRSRGSSIGHELDQGPTWRVEASESCQGLCDRPSDEQFTSKIWLQMFSMPLTNANHWAQGNNGSFTGIHRQLQRIFHRMWQSFDFIFLPNMQFECGVILQGTLGGNFDIFAIGEQGRWFCSGKKIRDVSPSWVHPRTQEEMRPVIHLRQNSLMILMFRLDLVDLRNLLDLLDRQVRLAYQQDGLQLRHLLVIEKEWDLKVHRVGGYLCDLHHPSLNLFRFIWMMAMMISHHEKRHNGDGLDRVSE